MKDWLEACSGEGKAGSVALSLRLVASGMFSASSLVGICGGIVAIGHDGVMKSHCIRTQIINMY